MDRTISPLKPYPGLRPFTADEAGIFFGREQQTDELLARLETHHFIAVTGPSGCGKSSLVKAGLIPALRAGFMLAAGSRWRVCEQRPGQHPILSLATTLATPDVLGDEHDPLPIIEAALRFGPLGLTQIVRESPLFRDGSLVLIVDQFEEIFRFRERIDPDEADAFVRLLLTSAATPDVPIYIVITMRSDYLGDCALFHGLPEVINAGQYLTPRLTRDQCGAAIVGPARVCHGDVDPPLVNRLLNDFGPDPDQLPLLQHALMRMWGRKIARDASGEASSLVLTIDDYEAVGGLAHALSRHADEALAELTPAERRLAEVLFKRLTERGTSRRDTRAPARAGEIAAMAGVDVADVAAVAKVFGSEGRHFVTAPEGPITDQTLLDIGHESLIRQWGTLAAWVDEEAESATVYKRVVDFARLWTTKAAGVWRPPELDLALAWRDRQAPNAAWASRYSSGDDCATAMAFLDASREAWRAEQARAAAREEEERRRERERIEQAAERDRLAALAKAASAEAELERANAVVDRQSRRNRLLRATAAVLAVAILGLVAGIFWYRRAWIAEDVAYYNDYVKRFGVPQGVGEPLTTAQLRARPASYKLVRQGTRGNIIRMESVDSAGRYASQVGMAAGYFGDSADSDGTGQAVRWEYSYDSDDKIASELELDARGAQVASTIYMPSRDRRRRTAHFFGPNGEPLVSNQCADYVDLEFSEEGYEERRRYMDRRGRPAPGRDRAYQMEQKYDAAGRLSEIISLDANGNRMVDTYGNSIARQRYDERGYVVEGTLHDEHGAPTVGIDGYAARRMTWDEHGNMTAEALFDPSGRPTVNSAGWHRLSWERDADGDVVNLRYWGVDGQPATSEGCHQYSLERDDRGRVRTNRCLGADGKPQPDAILGAFEWRVAYDEHDRIVEFTFFDAERRPVMNTGGYHREEIKHNDRGHATSLAYFGVDGSPVTREGGYTRIAISYVGDREVSRIYLDANGKPVLNAGLYAEQRREYDRNGNLILESYFDTEGKPKPQTDRSAAIRKVYDDCGDVVEEWTLDAAGRLLATDGKYAGVRYDRDALGRARRVTYLSEGGAPTLSTRGIAGFEARHDALGNRIEERFFGVTGQPVRAKEGYAGLRMTYDHRRNRTRLEYLGVDGKPSTDRSGRIEEHTFDTRNRRVQTVISMFRQGSHELLGREETTYDERGRPHKELYFNADRRPLLLDTDIGNCAGILFNYDAAGKLTRQCLGVNGEPLRR